MAGAMKLAAAPAIAALVLLMASGFAAAVPDSTLCPFELGYNPNFNADGSALFCTKGQETFQVDEAGILARSLRGIGNSLRSLLGGIADGDATVFGRFVEPAASIALQDGPHPISDTAAIAQFVADVLVFPAGADKSALFQISQYHFLDNNDPRVASVHITVYTAKYTLNADSIWRFNLVNGARVWQLQQTSNLVLVPV
ncbi:hypothetical protein KFL_001310050 [Klebsormidium nitens]|uniref:Uncharacterized protein n=1 Tax=Klebsormidium nitens TaxID=105231 RepID=A0A1Y1HXT5_KLENI|nr:hypothetical protein KFL_001310050 [Klebsormidium nitens]|eukprot:GAQ82973.1 hypothetical protein KFL_001310050 [Klebsormidium nitens]